MIGGLRDRLGRRAARRAVRERQRRGLGPDPQRRSALVVLPSTRDEVEAAWRALESLGLGPERIVPVALAAVAYVPDRYAGRILIVEPSRGLQLPSAAAREAAWSPGPDVAINLLSPLHAAAALLVGGSPAAIRVGYADRRAEPFYDLLVGAPGDAEPGPEAVARALSQVQPSLFGPA